VVKDPHIAGAREMFVEVNHPVAGKMKITGSHIKLSETKPSVKTPSPLLGEHNDYVLKEYLNYSDEKIKELKLNKIV